jgi:hypothetical protein
MTTTFTATATVRVSGFQSPAHASIVAGMLGTTLRGALSAAVSEAAKSPHSTPSQELEQPVGGAT